MIRHHLLPCGMQARLAAQAVRFGRQLYIIGGWDPGFQRDGGEILNDIWVLDLRKAEWRQQQLSPEARHCLCTTLATCHVFAKLTTKRRML